jgi:hypothetical protein
MATSKKTGIHQASKSEAQRFAALFVDSDEYRQSLVRRIANDELPPAVETLLLAYRFGKPVERQEVTFPSGVPDYSGLSATELAARAAELKRELEEAQRFTESLDLAEKQAASLSEHDDKGVN